MAILKPTQFAGFSDCAVFASAGTQLIITTQVGPRILFYGETGGENLFLVKAEHQGLIDGKYHSYGGHRLWRAPECPQKTYTPDATAVHQTFSDGIHWFSSSPDDFGVQKSIGIMETDRGFDIHHRIINLADQPQELAPWAVTVMAPGGVCKVPQEPLRPQPENLLPVRPIVLWNYTNMQDSRFNWNKSEVTVSYQDVDEPQKFGTFVSQGWAEYTNKGYVFRKEFPALPGNYPDMGCNFECYTRAGMLEVESLGPIVILKPGDSVDHVEKWSIKQL